MIDARLCVMNKNDTYHSLREVCEQLTTKHLPKYVFNEMIWTKLEGNDLIIDDESLDAIDGYITDIEYVYSERGAFKYKKNRNKAVRLKRSYKERASI